MLPDMTVIEVAREQRYTTVIKTIAGDFLREDKSMRMYSIVRVPVRVGAGDMGC